MIKYMLVGHFNKYSHVALKWLKEKTAKKNPQNNKSFSAVLQDTMGRFNKYIMGMMCDVCGSLPIDLYTSELFL